MRHLRVLSLLALGVGACASSSELTRRADYTLASADRALAAGDYETAHHEQRRAEHLYQRATAKAWQEGKIPPAPPPSTPLPVFDPQLER